MSLLSKRISRRSFLKVLGAGAAGAALAACAPAPTATVPAQSTSTSAPALGPAKVRFAHMNCWSDSMCKGMQTMVADFNSSHKSIQVEAVEWSWSNYLATLTAAVSAGEAPDVMHVGWGEVVSLGRPYFEPLDSYLTDDLKTNIRDASWTSSRIDGKTLGVPVTEQLNEVHFYLEDVWAKAGISAPPKTWAEYVAAGQKLMSAGVGEAFGVPASGAPIVTWWLEAQFQNNSPVFVKDGDKWKHTLSTPEAIEAGKFWYGMWNDSKVIAQANLQRAGSDVMVPLFVDGKLGLLSAIVQTYFSLVHDHPEIKDRLRVAPVTRQKSPATMGGAFALSMFQQAKDKQAAWEFIQWGTSADVMKRYWVPLAQVLPTRKDVSYPDMTEKVAAGLQEYQQSQKVFPFIPEWEAIKGKVLTPVLGELASGGVGFDAGWDTLVKQIEIVIR